MAGTTAEDVTVTARLAGGVGRVEANADALGGEVAATVGLTRRRPGPGGRVRTGPASTGGVIDGGGFAAFADWPVRAAGTATLKGMNLGQLERLAGAAGDVRLARLADRAEIRGELDADVAFDSHPAAAPGRTKAPPRVTGRVRATGLRAGDLSLTESAEAEIAIRDGADWRVGPLTGRFGGGTFTAEVFGLPAGAAGFAPGAARVRLTLRDANAAQAAAPIPWLRDNVTGRLSMTAEGVLGSTWRLSGRGTLRRGTFLGFVPVDRWQLPATLTYDPTTGAGEARLTDAAAGIAGGTVTGTAKVTFGRGRGVGVDVATDFGGPDAGRLLNGAGGAAASGRVGGTLVLQGRRVRGLGDLTGTARLTLAGGQPRGVPIVSRVVPFLNGAGGTGGGGQKGALDATLRAGVVRVRRFTLSSSGVRVFAEGHRDGGERPAGPGRGRRHRPPGRRRVRRAPPRRGGRRPHAGRPRVAGQPAAAGPGRLPGGDRHRDPAGRAGAGGPPAAGGGRPVFAGRAARPRRRGRGRRRRRGRRQVTEAARRTRRRTLDWTARRAGRRHNAGRPAPRSQPQETSMLFSPTAARRAAGLAALLFAAAPALAQQGPTVTKPGDNPPEAAEPAGERPDADRPAGSGGKQTKSQEQSGGGKTESGATCPVMGDTAGGTAPTRRRGYGAGEWWPNQLDLSVLHQNPPALNPLGEDFDYPAEFAALDLDAVKKDIAAVMTDSQDWWPADYGNYGPFFIRMAWHSAGTYRTFDGRGGASSGTLRFAPLNSWPDNTNLDKARRLLWPVKQKYGRALSWADLMILTGNVALEEMGVETFGYGGGREDLWEPEADIYWGSETEWMGQDKRYAEKDPETGEAVLEKPLAASHLGLIYVNPQGPGGEPDPMASAKRIRDTFGRMAMDDEETVALIAGGHTFGKAHGAGDPEEYVDVEPEGAALEEQGLGWKNKYGNGNGDRTITSGLEGAWTSTPTEWSNGYFDNLFGYEWELTKSPAGAWQWKPKGDEGEGTVPDAFDSAKTHQPMMFTTDIALKTDPMYREISKRFHENPDEFERAFAKAWYKLVHRDMGPHDRLLGPEVAPPQLWQDPVPPVTHPLVDAAGVAELKEAVLATGLPVGELVETAWASASTFRDTDLRGGANGARIRLEPQRDWAVNDPARLAKVLETLEGVREEFNTSRADGTKISMADLIVLAGAAGIEEAVKKAGRDVTVPFVPGRTDATAEMTDAESFAVLEPEADGFRNYQSREVTAPGPELLVDKANLLTLTAPEMTVLVGGMRALGANAGTGPMKDLGVLTETPGTLNNAFFKNLLTMDVVWKKSAICDHFYEGFDRDTGEQVWTASSVDLVFGSNAQLRGIAEVYAADDADEKFVDDFIEAWAKVMTLDRFDLRRSAATRSDAVARK